MIHTPCPALHRDIGRYLAFMDEARTPLQEVIMPTTYEACVGRAELLMTRNPQTPGPGRYEGNDDALLAEWLDELSHDQSYLDEEAGDVSAAGWVGRIGRFLVGIDDIGFFYYYDDGTAVKAAEHFARVAPDLEAAIDEANYNL